MKFNNNQSSTLKFTRKERNVNKDSFSNLCIRIIYTIFVVVQCLKKGKDEILF